MAAIARRLLAAGLVAADAMARCRADDAKRGAAGGVWGSQGPERAAADRFDRSEALQARLERTQGMCWEDVLELGEEAGEAWAV